MNSGCKKYEDSCRCSDPPGECLRCTSSGLWEADPFCGSLPASEERCVCIKPENYCKAFLDISADCDSGPADPYRSTMGFSQSGGWVLTGVTSRDGICTYHFCSQGEGEASDDCRSSYTGKKCCPGDPGECNCTYTAPTEGTGEKIYGPGRWCTPPVEEGGVPPPGNYEYQYTNDQGEKCYKEVLGFDNGTIGGSECKNSCTGEECECVSCHCHSDCPPGYTCSEGNCQAPPPPSPTPA